MVAKVQIKSGPSTKRWLTLANCYNVNVAEILFDELLVKTVRERSGEQLRLVAYGQIRRLHLPRS